MGIEQQGDERHSEIAESDLAPGEYSEQSGGLRRGYHVAAAPLLIEINVELQHVGAGIKEFLTSSTMGVMWWQWGHHEA